MMMLKADEKWNYRNSYIFTSTLDTVFKLWKIIQGAIKFVSAEFQVKYLAWAYFTRRISIANP